MTWHDQTILHSASTDFLDVTRSSGVDRIALLIDQTQPSHPQVMFSQSEKSFFQKRGQTLHLLRLDVKWLNLDACGVVFGIGVKTKESKK
jgi:hypothetical protein